MKSEAKKEILTKERCIRDLLLPTGSQRGPEWRMLLFLLPLVLVVGLIVLLAYKMVDRAERAIIVGVFGGLTLLLVVAFVAGQMYTRRKNRKIQERSFHIERDLLVNVVHDAYYKFPIRHDNGLRDLLEFSDRKYFVQRRMYYQWSEIYNMSPQGVYNTSLAGDTFYLVIYDDDREKKPAMVYNAKFFDYIEELWENG